MRSFGSRGLTERRETLGMRRRPVRADEGVELCELLLSSRARILNLPAQLLDSQTVEEFKRYPHLSFWLTHLNWF